MPREALPGPAPMSIPDVIGSSDRLDGAPKGTTSTGGPPPAPGDIIGGAPPPPGPRALPSIGAPAWIDCMADCSPYCASGMRRVGWLSVRRLRAPGPEAGAGRLGRWRSEERRVGKE